VDPVSIGYERAFESPPGGRPQAMKTLSVDPPIFLLSGFLSRAEAEEVRRRATDWKSSEVQGDEKYTALEEMDAIDREEMLLETLPSYDLDGDALLDEWELSNYTRNVLNLLDYGHAAFLKRALGEEGKASSIPLETVAADGLLADYCLEIARQQPHRRMRHSKHAGYDMRHHVGQKILDRLSLVTGLPTSIIKQSREQMQVVHYPENGHYSCHHDGGRDFPERLLTVGMFLNDVPSGGHTVFPAVGTDATAESWDQFFVDQCPSRCVSHSGLAIQPRRGDAIFWYNLQPDRLEDVQRAKARKERPDLSGQALLNGTAHCGAPVLEGEKYFANFWLTVPDGGFKVQDAVRQAKSSEL